MLKRAKEEYPALRVEVVESDLAQLEDNLLNGQLELALSYGLGGNEHIHYDPLANCPPYVLLPESHELAQSESLSLQQLCNEPLVLLDLPHSGDYFLSLFKETGCQPEVAYRSRSFEMIRCAVASGLGFSLLNQRPRTNQAYNGGMIKMIPLKDSKAKSLQIEIARYIDFQPSVRAKVITKIMHEIVGDNLFVDDA